MFITSSKYINTKNKFMIYDEVDMMANPLSCELNIPNDKTNLTDIKLLFDISGMLYNGIFNI